MSKKFVIIGSGSQFTEFFFQEFFKGDAFRGCTLSLVDRKPDRLEHELALARMLNESVGSEVTIEGGGDREQALDGADFVYCFAAVNSAECWKKEFELANKYDIHPLEAYTAGTAGLGMAIRHVPLMLDLCADIERICPDAWLIMENNPLAKLASAVENHANVKYIAYCNGHELIEMALEQILDLTDRDPALRKADPLEREFLVPAGNVEMTLGGVNHCTWILDLHCTATGEDLYPRLRECVENPELVPEGYQYSVEIFKRFGLFPSPADNHLADYLWCTDPSVHKWMGMEPYPVDNWFGNRDASAWEKVRASVVDSESAAQFVSRRRTGWRHLQIARQLLSAKPSCFPALNFPNRGAIENLPPETIVEVPAVLSAQGARPVQVGPLPDAIAATCSLHGTITNLVADAAAIGCKEKALHALLLDPFVHSMTVAEKLLEDILDYNSKYDTRF